MLDRFPQEKAKVQSLLIARNADSLTSTNPHHRSEAPADPSTNRGRRGSMWNVARQRLLSGGQMERFDERTKPYSDDAAPEGLSQMLDRLQQVIDAHISYVILVIPY